MENQTTPDDTALLRQALETLEPIITHCLIDHVYREVMSNPDHFINKTLDALRQRLGESK
jgi:deoxyribodipyrimidine photolyase